MHISAVISEFNPFHLGHKYLIDNIRKNGTTHIVTIMSGNFVQRGEPAILSKRARTEIVLNSGVDLVIEMPAVWSIAGAERYAYTGVRLIDGLGCIDSLCFGSECGDIELLSKVSDILSEEGVFTVIKRLLKQGMTYAKARELAVHEVLGDDFSSILREPNNILAVEYIKAVNKIKSKIALCTVKRKGAGHNSLDVGIKNENIISASAVRRYIRENKDIKGFVPDNSQRIIKREVSLGRAPSDIMYAERAVLAKLRSLKVEEILRLPDISEGIEYRIFESIKKSRSLEELCFSIKTKRYTMSRIKRIVLSAFLDVSKQIQLKDVPYIRVLGFNQKGREVLNIMKSTAKLPIISSYREVKKQNGDCIEVFERESAASDLYSLTLPKITECNIEKTSKIIVVR